MKLEQVNQVPQRDGYGQGLLELCKTRQDVVVLDADVSAATRTNWVHDQYPDHFYNLGISEQHLVGTAAGLAVFRALPLEKIKKLVYAFMLVMGCYILITG